LSHDKQYILPPSQQQVQKIVPLVCFEHEQLSEPANRFGVSCVIGSGLSWVATIILGNVNDATSAKIKIILFIFFTPFLG